MPDAARDACTVVRFAEADVGRFETFRAFSADCTPSFAGMKDRLEASMKDVRSAADKVRVRLFGGNSFWCLSLTPLQAIELHDGFLNAIILGWLGLAGLAVAAVLYVVRVLAENADSPFFAVWIVVGVLTRIYINLTWPRQIGSEQFWLEVQRVKPYHVSPSVLFGSEQYRQTPLLREVFLLERLLPKMSSEIRLRVRHC